MRFYTETIDEEIDVDGVKYAVGGHAYYSKEKNIHVLEDYKLTIFREDDAGEWGQLEYEDDPETYEFIEDMVL